MDKRSKRTVSIEQVSTVDTDPISTAVAAALATQQATFQQVVDAQSNAFHICLQTFMDATNKRFDNYINETTITITELKTSLQFTQIQLQEIKQTTDFDRKQHTDTEKKMNKIENELRRIDDNVDYMENQSRRNNLRVDGIKERPGETWAETEEALRKALHEQLKLPVEQVAAIRVERAHRTGAATDQHRDRTVMVKFTSFKDRDVVLRAARTIRPRGVFVNEDHSQRVMARRKELLPAMKEATEKGKIAYLSFDRLVVKDRQAQ